jgi:hypothetical protein
MKSAYGRILNTKMKIEIVHARLRRTGLGKIDGGLYQNGSDETRPGLHQGRAAAKRAS